MIGQNFQFHPRTSQTSTTPIEIHTKLNSPSKRRILIVRGYVCFGDHLLRAPNDFRVYIFIRKSHSILFKVTFPSVSVGVGSLADGGSGTVAMRLKYYGSTPFMNYQLRHCRRPRLRGFEPPRVVVAAGSQEQIDTTITTTVAPYRVSLATKTVGS